MTRIVPWASCTQTHPRLSLRDSRCCLLGFARAADYGGTPCPLSLRELLRYRMPSLLSFHRKTKQYWRNLRGNLAYLRASLAYRRQIVQSTISKNFQQHRGIGGKCHAGESS